MTSCFSRSVSHERQPPVTLQWVFQVEPDDGLFLPLLQRNPGVVLVHLPVGSRQS